MQKNIDINPNCIIGECLETAFNLKAYMNIMNAVSEEGFRATPEFRKKYNGFYRVRQKSQEWYDTYYGLMEDQKRKPRTMGEILERLYSVKPSVEVSFASKLMATINPDYPIWDQYVLRNLGFEKEWENSRNASPEKRIEKAVDLYGMIQDFYLEFEKSEDGKKCIAVIDRVLPMYADSLTDTKKIDYVRVGS